MAFDPISAGIAGGTTVLGAVGGGLAAGDEAKRKKKYYQDLSKGIGGIAEDVGANATTRMGEVDTQYNPYLKDFGTNAQDYFGALKNTDYSQFDLKDPGSFDFNMQEEIQNQLNPELQAIIDRSTGAVTASAANAGNLFSGATAKGIARSTADIQAKEWGVARDAAQEERKSKYQQWTDKFDQAAKISEQNRSNLNMGLQNQGSLYNAQSGMFTNAQTQKSGIQNAADTSKFNLQGQQVGADAAANSQPGYWSAFGQGALSGLAGGVGGAADIYGAFKK